MHAIACLENCCNASSAQNLQYPANRGSRQTCLDQNAESTSPCGCTCRVSSPEETAADIKSWCKKVLWAYPMHLHSAMLGSLWRQPWKTSYQTLRRIFGIALFQLVNDGMGDDVHQILVKPSQCCKCPNNICLQQAISAVSSQWG